MTSSTAMARSVRRSLVEISHRDHIPHLGSSLSCVDILAALYGGVLSVSPERASDPDRDRFLLSKGHAACALYATLSERGFIPRDLLRGIGSAGHPLEEHPGPRCAPGVEAATGSLGHGLSLGAGMALAGRLQGRSYRVYVLMSDGECNEGSVWEAAMLAPALRLERLAAIIDFNGWQATGRSRETTALDPLAAKWAAFGWSVREVDGHDPEALDAALRNVPDGTGRPVAVVARTVKGKGISFMEDDNNWHYRIPDAGELTRALAELGGS